MLPVVEKNNDRKVEISGDQALASLNWPPLGCAVSPKIASAMARALEAIHRPGFKSETVGAR